MQINLQFSEMQPIFGVAKGTNKREQYKTKSQFFALSIAKK
jgi:hypothetical protein